MNLRRTIVLLSAAVLCVGLFGATALAGKKKKTVVVVNSGPVLSGKQNVKVSGQLNTTSGCKAARAMKLFLTDASGAVISTLDGSTSDVNGNWRLQGKLFAAPEATDRLQVKAVKRAVGKTVCKAGFSPLIVIN